MKHFLTVICLLFAFSAFGQTWQPNGTKYPNATNEGDTVTVQARLPMIDENGLLNYYLPIQSLIDLNPVVTWETITGNQGSVNISGFNNDVGYISSYTETDPTVPSHVKSITTGNINTWNSALQPGDNLSELTDDIGITTQTENDARYVNVGGDTMTGNLILDNSGNHGLLTGDDSQRLLIGGGSTWSGSNGAYISIEGIDYGGTGQGGNARFALPGGKNVYINGGIVFHEGNHRSDSQNDARYIRSDINDDNGVNTLTLGGLILPSIPVGVSTYDQLVVNPTTGEVGRVSVGAFSFDVGNGSTTQFTVDSTTPELNFVGSGDTSVSFNGSTNTVTITSTPGAGGGGAVTSFEGRDGAVVSAVGDYDTNEVVEAGNLYFTDGRVRSTTLTGLSVTNTPITSTNSFLQALGRLQGQINNREVSFSKNTAFNKNFGTSAGTVAQGNHTHTFASITNKPTTLSGYGISDAYTKIESDGRYVNIGGDTMTGNLLFDGSDVNMGLLRGDDDKRILIGGGSNWAAQNGAYISIEGIDYGGTGQGGNARFSLSGGKNVYINGDIVYHSGNLRSNAQNDSRYALQTTTINTGTGLTGGGNLSANRTLSFDASWGDSRYVNLTGDTMTGNLILDNSGNHGLLTGDDSQRLLIGGGSTWSGSNGAYITLEGVNFGGTGQGSDITLTPSAGGKAYVGSDEIWTTGNLRSNTENDARYARLSYNTNLGFLRTSGNIISDANLQGSGLIVSGAGSFSGRVSGADAVNPNEFVTRQQVVPLSTQQTGVVRAVEAVSSSLYVDSGSLYMERGGTQYSLTIPAGTFQQSGRGILEIEGIMEVSNVTANKTILVYITFSQGGIVYDSDPMALAVSTTGGGGFAKFEATLTSRMSAGYFYGKGLYTGTDANGSITSGFTINPPTSLDFRESFTIRMKVNSPTGYTMNLIPFTVKVSDLPN